MALYSFYPCQMNGSSLSFETYDVRGDAEAFVQAILLLQQHSNAAYVAVWRGERSVCSVPRDHAGVAAAVSHGQPSASRDAAGAS